MASFTETKQNTVAAIRSQSGKGLIIGMTCLVVLSVSLLSCVTYITLMGNTFPDGLFKSLTYLGAFANFILMIVLLAGKFTWFRPGYHEWASWGVTALEIGVTILNLMLAFQLNNHIVLTDPLKTWYMIAPITPVFSMVGAIILIITSSEMQRKHKDMVVQEQMEESEQNLRLLQHKANIAIQETYVNFVHAAVTQHLQSAGVRSIVQAHAEHRALEAIAAISGLPATMLALPQTVEGSAQQLPADAPSSSQSLAQTGTLDVNAFLAQLQEKGIDISSLIPPSVPQQQAQTPSENEDKGDDTGKGKRGKQAPKK